MNLLALHCRLRRDLDSLAASVDEPPLDRSTPSSCNTPHELGREAALVRLHDRWNNFVRELILLSTIGGVHRASGLYVPRQVGVPTRYDALVKLRSTYTGRQRKPPRWEPKWFDAAEAIDAAQRLAPVNLNDISAAIGSTPSPLAEIRAVRNYVAHRGRQAADNLRAYIPTASVGIHQFLTQPVSGGVSRFRNWTIYLDLISRAAVD